MNELKTCYYFAYHVFGANSRDRQDDQIVGRFSVNDVEIVTQYTVENLRQNEATVI